MNDATILITGATAGIGRAAALHLAESRFRVFATGRNEAQLAALEREGAGRIEALRLDVADPASIAAAAAVVRERTGGRGIDVLVNNAGYGQMGPLLDVTDGQLRAQFETNVFGLMAVTRAFLPGMVERRRGRIINISSGGGRMSFPLAGAYTATKFALEAMSDALRMELAPFGLQVVVIEPGPIKTHFSGTAVGSLPGDAHGGSPYAPIYARADAARDASDAISWPPEAVARAIARAVRARRPRARYTVPGILGPILWLSHFLPTAWQDRGMRLAIGLTPRVLAAGSAAR